MTTKYLLPCACGRKVPIEVVQSGQTVQCQCGLQLEVPTMLQIRSLEPVEEEVAPPAARTWNLRKGLVLLGGLIAVTAIAVAVHLYISRPRLPAPPALETVRGEYTERLPLRETFAEWEILQEGPNRAGAQVIARGYELTRSNHMRWLTVSVVVALLGVACAASSLLVPDSPENGPDEPVEPAEHE